MKYITSGCWTSWVRESLCRLWLPRDTASPELVAFLQRERRNAVTSRVPLRMGHTQQYRLRPLHPPVGSKASFDESGGEGGRVCFQTPRKGGHFDTHGVQ
jgi:hypothetical protein